MIGVFDSGSGGLTILSAFHKALPHEDFLYLGDHARTPYGEQSNEKIISMTQEMVSILFEKNCSLVILACNTASTIALRHLQENWLPSFAPDKRILGVHIPVVEALTGLTWDRDETKTNIEHGGGTVVVFATSKTVASGTYSRQVKLRAPNYILVEQACPHLAQTIENDMNGANTDQLVKKYVAEALQKCQEPPQAVILGCTHYPLVKDSFKKYLPAGVEILDQPTLVSNSLQAYLQNHGEFKSKAQDGTLTYMTTGEPEKIKNFDIMESAKLPQFVALK